MTTTTHTSIDGGALRRAVAGRDAEAIAALYADDATVEIVDAGNPPSAPLVLHGATEIAERLRDVYGREMTHEVDVVSVSPDALGFTVRCRYPDGGRVLCSSLSELRDGRIAKETILQVWDA
jgi:ketosteroid isomerase-like protein